MLKSDFITSPIYESVKIIQFLCEIGIDGFVVRVEIFQGIKEKSKFYFEVWRSEVIDAVPMLATENASFEILHHWSPYLSISPEENSIEANDLEKAQEIIFSYLQKYFDKIKG